MRKDFFLFLTLSLLLVFPGQGLISQEWETTECCCCPEPLPPHKFYVGPEFDYVRRTREGGTKQWGPIYGVRGGYDRLKNWGFYWGFEGHWAQGCINGHSGNSDALKSTFTDSHVEGRLGYTLQANRWFCPSFTPFAGIGYFWERNSYCHPSPLHLQFLNKAPYGVLGFLSNVELTYVFAVGLNFKACFMYDAECEVSRDPEFGRTTLKIGDKVNYRVELPFTYHIRQLCQNLDAALIPFYESRHYGKRIGYPFAFLDTRLHIYGVNLQFSYRL